MIFPTKLILFTSSALMSLTILLILSDINTHLIQAQMFHNSISPLIQLSPLSISFNHDPLCSCPTCLGLIVQSLS